VFRGFQANLAVTYKASDGFWHWDGTYSFTQSDDD
jgi:hypothetical protein